ncbi:hypothetical protein WJM95_23975 [Streptomyces sp. f51]|uniref:hypothetical protein n=1 Tax=Streptomyces sp. f51 TaxID=1827742 RepID=UPI0030D4F3EC
MITTTDALPVVLVAPPPDALVIPMQRARPGIDLAMMSRFAESSWCLSDMEKKESGRGKTLHWGTVPEPLRASLKHVTWALINLPTPDFVLKRPGSTARPSIAAGTVEAAWVAWRHFARWLVARQITSLDQVTVSDLRDYAGHLRGLGRTWAHDRNWLFAITRMWAYSPFLLPSDRLCMPPWDNPEVELTEFLGENDDPPRGENSTEVIHPATMAPLLIWALRMITDIAPGILAAVRERRRLLGNVVRTGQKGNARPTAEARRLIRDYFEELRSTGRPIPTYEGPGAPTIALTRGSRNPKDRFPIGWTFIAGILGVSAAQVYVFARDFPEELDGLTLAAGSPLDVPIAALDGRPWTPQITFDQTRELAPRLSTAALIVITYLSGMRSEEALHLERGCCSREEGEAGTVRYRVKGRHFKGVTGEDGNTIPEGEMRPEPWTVIDLVHRAIAVAEELTDERLLFPRSLTTHRTTAVHKGEALSAEMAKDRIQSFMSWANRLAAAHGRSHELIPPDPNGIVALGRFRRTVAWHIYRQPGGRVALGIQYGHVGASMSESYGARTRFDMLDVLDFEQGLAMADTLAEAADRLEEGDHVSGTAAGRYVDAVREFKARYEGVFLTKNQIKALPTDPSLRIYENPKAFLTCNYDPFKALCHRDRAPGPSGQRTPSLDRCHKACANISRSDTHMTRVQDEIDSIRGELTDDALPQPLRTRLQQRGEMLGEIVTQHEASRVPLATAAGETET